MSKQQNILNVDYLATPDGYGGKMKDHYHHDAKPMNGRLLGCRPVPEHVPMKVVDDYSSGIHPGFTLPATGHKSNRDLFEKERQIELTFAMQEDCGEDESLKPGLEFQDSPVKQLKDEFESEAKTKFVTPRPSASDTVNVFSPEEWSDMAALID
jgi:hypothetical protein